MFKLVKILNSGCNVAEPIRVRCAISRNYTQGAAGRITGVKNKPAENCTGDAIPDFIFGEESKSRSGKIIKAYPVSRHMIFITTFSEDPTGLLNGDHVTFSNTGDKVTAVKDGGGCVEIYDMNGATKAGDSVYVRFDI